MLTLHPSLEEFRHLSRSHNVVAVWAELAADYETPLSAFRKIAREDEDAFLFESAENTQVSGRFSFLGSQPRAMFFASGNEVTMVERGRRRSFSSQSNPLRDLEACMARYRPAPAPHLPVFHGGAVGFLSYDAVRYFEPTVPQSARDDLGLPDMAFMIADTVVIFDHRYRLMQVVANVCLDDFSGPDEALAAARVRIETLISKLEAPVHFRLMSADAEPTQKPAAASNMTREQYEAGVRRAKEYIAAGDIFQVVPSQRFAEDFSGAATDLYRALRHVNPSPYMFCLQFARGYALVGSSPEVHVRCLDGRVEIRPIAGTRRRGQNSQEDDVLAQELLNDPKERAEHIMLVDLARNDVGRVAEFGSVRVTDLMIIERYSHVMHIVSNVEGRLRQDKTAYDVMAATFPAGTVSGSPKVRAMQIINELEPSKRNAYAGAVGYFGFDGNLDSCIALRTCVLKDGKAYVQAGAGIVADSDPAAEYIETVTKAQGMLRAIARAKSLAE
ncbi:MAG: anthranilate synthase component I [Verrucomicrobiales bacterium]